MALRLMPCVDGPGLAEARRRELQLGREQAARLGLSAIHFASEGRYRTDDGREVDWGVQVKDALAARVSIPPDRPLPSTPGGGWPETRVTVSNETTLGAARGHFTAGRRPLALNFANGIEPGGGVLRGALAQEEVLCRSSALYLTLHGDPMYAVHREQDRHGCSDWAILSPDVPVFRRDDGGTLDEPWPLAVLTCAAPYAPGLGQPRAGDLLQARIDRVLAIAEAYGYDTLVLGAWGCGAFGNEPHRTARDFHAALAGRFSSAFREVGFAIADWSPERRFLGPFRDRFAPGS